MALADWDLLLTGTNIATLAEGSDGYGVVPDAALAVKDGRIAWLGPASDLPAKTSGETRNLDGRWLTPALIDCHTHIVFAGDRSAEFEMRRTGASYEDIARAGGGIMSTVNATRDASQAELVSAARRRLRSLRMEGVATVEIKSGYGLDLDTEIRMLEAARTLGDQSQSTITTFLGAHTVPAEFSGRADDYISFVVDEVLPAVHENQLADAVDAFCETIAFTTDQVARVFEKARDLGLQVKLHADQLSDGGGAALAASFGALSADHLEYTGESGVRAMADSGTVAVMLPGAFLVLGETQHPPIAALRDSHVPMAVATDCNPGTSPVCSLRTAMSLAVSLFELTPEECLAGVTRVAAQALGLSDRGTLSPGLRADIAEWDIDHPRELAYWIGLNQLHRLYVGGREAFRPLVHDHS
jgi:imidazolonepropionase